MKRIGKDVFVAEGARIVGNVTIGDKSSIWFNAVLRGDEKRIGVGEETNIQDNCVVHAGARIGNKVSIGHGAIVHGCVIEDECLIGMGSIILDKARIGKGSLVAAGTIVLPGTRIPKGSFVAGVPGMVKRKVTKENVKLVRDNCKLYLELKKKYQR